MSIEEYDQKFDMVSCFASELVDVELSRVERFVRGLRNDIRGFVWAFKLATQVEALRLVVEMSTQEDDVQPKTLGKRTLSAQKRKANQKPVGVP